MNRYFKVLFSTAVLLILVVFSTVAANAEDSVNKIGFITGSVVNLREEPNTSSKVLDKLDEGTQVKVIASKSGWHKVNHDGTIGWVSGDYITVKEATLGIGTVKVEVLNIRSKPNTDSEVISKLNQGDKVTVLSASGDWYKIRTSDDTVGYIFSEYLILNKDSKTSRGSDEDREDSSSNSSSAGQKLVSYAKNYVGADYDWGGTSPDGFDCSGFVYYVFKHFDITVERTAEDQSRQGTAVSKSNLEAGDLVFFDTSGSNNGNITHVGIYVGGNKFIHAANESKGVIITSLSDDYYSSRYVKARRILD